MNFIIQVMTLSFSIFQVSSYLQEELLSQIDENISRKLLENYGNIRKLFPFSDISAFHATASFALDGVGETYFILFFKTLWVLSLKQRN